MLTDADLEQQHAAADQRAHTDEHRPEPDEPQMTSKMEAATMAGNISLSDQQAKGLAKVKGWYVDNRDPSGREQQVFRLFGYAGTGKTTIANVLTKQPGVQTVVFATFTGKAAYVLRKKGAPASTIHSLIYLPQERVRQRLAQLMEELDAETDESRSKILERKIKAEQKRLENPDWLLREPEDTDLYGADLLVIDEVSMVGERIALDLLSFGVPTLVLGDPAQLPPVEGGGWFIDYRADHLLTEVHRSALDSPVTRIATAIRNATTADLDYGVDAMDGDSGRADWLTVAELLDADQVLVGTNKTRWQANHLLRALRGLTGEMPRAGDKIMCLANSSNCGVFNGQQFEVINVLNNKKSEHADRITLAVRDDEGKERDLTCWRAGFASMEGEQLAKRDGRGSVAAATWGWAITTHKAQGSQWDSVLVIDESGVFASIEQKNTARALKAKGSLDRGESHAAGHRAGQRWLYTAATRAAQRVVMIPSLNGTLR